MQYRSDAGDVGCCSFEQCFQINIQNVASGFVETGFCQEHQFSTCARCLRRVKVVREGSNRCMLLPLQSELPSSLLAPEARLLGGGVVGLVQIWQRGSPSIDADLLV